MYRRYYLPLLELRYGETRTTMHASCTTKSQVPTRQVPPPSMNVSCPEGRNDVVAGVSVANHCTSTSLHRSFQPTPMSTRDRAGPDAFRLHTEGRSRPWHRCRRNRGPRHLRCAQHGAWRPGAGSGGGAGTASVVVADAAFDPAGAAIDARPPSMMLQ